MLSGSSREDMLEVCQYEFSVASLFWNYHLARISYHAIYKVVSLYDMIIQRESVINYHEISVLENKSFINWTNLHSSNNYIYTY